jgi:hypothetical protein
VQGLVAHAGQSIERPLSAVNCGRRPR